MKTQDIKNIASAYMQVHQSELEEKKKMDPVGQEDDDIDNDGDTDSTDKYLHNRRKAIAKAMKKEEVEDLDERLVFWKSKSNNSGQDEVRKKEKARMNNTSKQNHDKRLGMAMSGSHSSDHNGHEGAYVQHRNAAEEHKDTAAGKHHAAAAASHDTAADHLDKYKKSGDVKHLNSALQHSEKAAEHAKKAYKAGGTNTDSHLVHHDTKWVKREHSNMNEAVELDELSKKTLGSYVKKAAGDAVTKAYKAGDVRDKDSGKNYMKALGRQIGISKATSKLAKEEVNLDEAKDGDGANIVRDKEFKGKSLLGKTPVPYKPANPDGPHYNTGKKAIKKEAKDGDGANIVRDKEFKGKSLLGKTPVPYKPANPKGAHYSTGIKSMKKEDADMSMKEKLQLQKESILEREMTDAEKKKREDIVMGMKKNKADLEKRYGSRWKDVMYATATKQAMESVDDALKMTKNLLTTKESFKTETTTWPVYARIKEANDRAMHYKGATPPETMDAKLTASDKAFLAPHGELKGNDSGIDGEKAAEYTAKHATDGIKPGGGMNRTGDQKTGDKNIIKSTQSNEGSKIMDNFVRKIKEAYAEMLKKQNSEISEISQQAKKNYLKKAIGSDKDEPESPSLANLKTARNIPQKYRTSHTSAITSKDKDLDRSIANRKKGIERATGSAKTAQAVSKDVNKAASEFSKEYPNIKKGYSHLSRASKKAGVDK